MRSGCGCDEIVRELSAPSSAIPSDQVAEHLRDCPSCASWAGQIQTFDRLWRESALPEPSAEAWGQAWGQVLQSAQANRGWFSFGSLSSRASEPRVLSIVAGRRQRGRIAAIVAGLAASAALAVTAANSLGWLDLKGGSNRDADIMANGDQPAFPAPHPSAIRPVSLDLSEGQVGFIRVIKGDQPEVEIETQELDDEDSGLLGTDMALLSHFEGISQ